MFINSCLTLILTKVTSSLDTDSQLHCVFIHVYKYLMFGSLSNRGGEGLMTDDLRSQLSKEIAGHVRH